MDTLWSALMDAPTAEAAAESLEAFELWAAAQAECTCNGLEAQACEVCRGRIGDDEIPFVEETE